MPISAVGLGIASLFLTGISIASNVKASNQAREDAREQKKIQQADRRLAELRNRRQKVEELRKGRIARATILSSAETSGGAGSSGALGGAAAVQSQTGSNIGFLSAVNETSKTIFASNQRRSDLGASISQHQAFASITGTLGQTFSPGVKELFKSNTGVNS